MKISYDYETKINVYDDEDNLVGILYMSGVNYGGDIHYEPTPGNAKTNIKNLHDALSLMLNSLNTNNTKRFVTSGTNEKHNKNSENTKN